MVAQCTDGGRSRQLMAAAPESITWMDRVLQRHYYTRAASGTGTPKHWLAAAPKTLRCAVFMSSEI